MAEEPRVQRIALEELPELLTQQRATRLRPTLMPRANKATFNIRHIKVIGKLTFSAWISS